MGHSVLELVRESRLSELLSLEVDLILDGGVVTEGDFLPGLFLTHSVLLLERVERAHRQCDVRKREGIGAVS